MRLCWRPKKMSTRKRKKDVREDQYCLLDLKEVDRTMQWILSPEPGSPYDLADMEPETKVRH